MSKGKKEPRFNDEVWDVDGVELHEDCPHMQEKLTVHMPLDIYSKVEAMNEEMGIEWMGYFRGYRDDGDAYIEELVIPEQEVSSVKAENKEPVGDTIGIIHSHHSMGSWHSHDDEESATQNGFSLVVDNDMEFDAKGRVELPCGGWGQVDVSVIIESQDMPDEAEWAKEQTEKIKEKTYTHKTKKGKIRQVYGGFVYDGERWIADEEGPDWVRSGSWRRRRCPECNRYTMKERVPTDKHDDKYCETCGIIDEGDD